MTATAANLDRLDCLVDGRPTLTTDVQDGANPLTVRLAGQAGPTLRFAGYAARELVAERIFLVTP